LTGNSVTSSPQPGAAATEANWNQRFWLFWTAITAWRLCYLAVSPLELAMDEAYYWDWGRLPDWGYYSKPPLIAWINTASSALFGASEFGVRLPAVLMGAARRTPWRDPIQVGFRLSRHGVLLLTGPCHGGAGRRPV
jgi:hypothetical protein